MSWAVGGWEVTEMSGQSNIEIYLRLKPVGRGEDVSHVTVDAEEGVVGMSVPGGGAGVADRDAEGGYVLNNNKSHYKYAFNGIFGMEAKQEEVFERVGSKIVRGALEGINGTLFAYGQTGSGKTFTITGGAERYADRGIIPRALQLIFQEVKRRSDAHYQVHISYLELYNERGYDLLDPDHETRDLEDLPRVTLQEDDAGRTVLKGLNRHLAGNEEEALNLLFLGDTNRMIAETPMNMASSRSHCVFTVYFESRRVGDNKVRRSKLNLVDLAGSERVKKTSAEGKVLSEAKYINSSLHFLELVIGALREQGTKAGRSHIPYRNSMITQVLRDSLGGNCKTAMVATVTPERGQFEEGLSTCRFAQRVAQVSNVVMVNEEVDPSILIKRLKGEVRDLKAELRMARGEEEERGPLTADELKRLDQTVDAYVHDAAPDETLHVGSAMMWIQAAFASLKRMVLAGGGSRGGAAGAAPAGPAPTGRAGVDDDVHEQVAKLKLQIQQRDNEINILVSMLKKKGGAKGNALEGVSPAPVAAPEASPVPVGVEATPPPAERGAGATPGTAGRDSGALATPPTAVGKAKDMSALEDTAMLQSRNQLFEVFRKSYRKNEIIEENKAELKRKYTDAKAVGELVSAARDEINKIKVAMEHRRKQLAVARISSGDAAGGTVDDSDDPIIVQLKAQVEVHKGRYRESYDKLREAKREIEHLQKLLEKSRVGLQSDFQKWLSLQSSMSVGDLHKVQTPHTPTVDKLAPGHVHESPAKWASKRDMPIATGNDQADADIMAFFKAKEELLARKKAAAGAPGATM